MKRIGLSLSDAYLAGFAAAVLSCLACPGIMTIGSDLLAGPGERAVENEWTPSNSELPGVIEQTLQKALQSEKSSKSTQSAQPSLPANLEFFLPSDSPSINLNSMHINKQPEDATMNRATTAMAALLGAALLAAPARGEDPKVDLNDAVRKLEAAVKKLEAAEGATKAIGAVDKGLTDYKASNSAAVRQIQDDLSEMRLKLNQLELDVKFLRQSAGGAPSSTSKRESMPEGSSKLGTIRLSNEFPEMMSVDVNGVFYQLPPGQTRTIKIEPGVFTYQVLQVQSRPQQRSIVANEEKTIRIHAQ